MKHAEFINIQSCIQTYLQTEKPPLALDHINEHSDSAFIAESGLQLGHFKWHLMQHLNKESLQAIEITPSLAFWQAI